MIRANAARDGSAALCGGRRSLARSAQANAGDETQRGSRSADDSHEAITFASALSVYYGWLAKHRASSSDLDQSESVLAMGSMQWAVPCNLINACSRPLVPRHSGVRPVVSTGLRLQRQQQHARRAHELSFGGSETLSSWSRSALGSTAQLTQHSWPCESSCVSAGDRAMHLHCCTVAVSWRRMLHERNGDHDPHAPPPHLVSHVPSSGEHGAQRGYMSLA